jgi:hypothetical protein
VICVYSGRFNSFCGNNETRALITTNGGLVGVQITFPGVAVYFTSSAQSASTAALQSWSVQGGPQQGQVSGSIVLSSTGLSLQPTQDPFDVDGCSFQGFVGTFVTAVQS